MTSYRLYEWLRAMFELTWSLSNFTFGQLFMWIGANNDQIWLPIGYIHEWLWAMFKLTWTWPNFTFGQLLMWIGQIMTRYDFLWARWVILHDSFSDCFIILHRGAVLLEEYICRVNMAYMVKLGQLRVNITK